MAQPDIKGIEKRLKAVTDYVRDCELRVLKGDLMDLQGLDRNVIEICEELSKLPPKQARSLETQMKQLIGNLDTLALSMKGQRDKMTATRRR